MLPIVALFRELSAVKTYEAVVQKAIALGLQPLNLKKIPIRRDVMKIMNQSILKREKTIAHISRSTSSERGLDLKGLSIAVSDETAGFEEVVMEISKLLGAEPEYPAEGAQFAFLENDAGRTPLSLKQTSAWADCPTGSLVHVTVSAWNSGAMILRIEQRTA